MDFQWRFKRQHANEMHGPDAACQAKRSEQTPLSLRTGMFDMIDALGDAEHRKAAGTGHEIGKKNEEGVMPAVHQNLVGGRKLSENMQS
ncbi:hypothetical protein D3C85_1612250 [compost metagenome]